MMPADNFGGGNLPGYYCEKCQKNYDTCKPAYNFSMKLQDHSESVFVSLLGENPAEDIIGMSAQELRDLGYSDPGNSAAGAQDVMQHPKIVE